VRTLQATSGEMPIKLDSDSYKYAIESCCSYLIVKHKRDFTGKVMLYNIRSQGFTGTNTIKWKGTWKFNIEDDSIKRTIKIPNTMYSKESPYHSFCNSTGAKRAGTYCRVGDNSVKWSGKVETQKNYRTG
jgi:hypothetical protein